MKKSLNKFIKGYMEVLYALSSRFLHRFLLLRSGAGHQPQLPAQCPLLDRGAGRYSFIYMVAFGVGLAALKHEFVNVEFLGDFLKSKNQKALDVLNLVIEVIILAMCLVILVMAEPKYCFPTFAMNSTATNISMKYIYFSQFLTFIILPVSYLLDIVRTLVGWTEKPAA